MHGELLNHRTVISAKVVQVAHVAFGNSYEDFAARTS